MMPQQKLFAINIKLLLKQPKIESIGATKSYFFNFLIFIYAYEASKGSWNENKLPVWIHLNYYGWQRETFFMESNFVEIIFDIYACFYFWCSLRNGRKVVWQKVLPRRWKIHNECWYEVTRGFLLISLKVIS